MDKQNRKLHASDAVAIFVIVAGLCLGGFLLMQGASLWGSFIQVMLCGLVSGLIILMGEGLRTGKLGIRGGYVYRDKHTIFFWAFMLFYGLVVVAIPIVSILAVFGG